MMIMYVRKGHNNSGWSQANSKETMGTRQEQWSQTKKRDVGANDKATIVNGINSSGHKQQSNNREWAQQQVVVTNNKVACGNNTSGNKQQNNNREWAQQEW